MPALMLSSFVSTAGDLGSVVAGAGILGSAIVWLWRRSRRRVFPNPRLEITGAGYLTVERVINVAGASNSQTQAHLENVAITYSRRPVTLISDGQALR